MSWHFSTLGFFTVVCLREGEGATAKINKNKVMVRARLVEHLKNLQALCAEDVPAVAKAEIIITPTYDFIARIIVPKRAWIAALGLLEEGVNYDRFKPACAKRKNDEYAHALHEVWGIMNSLQAHEPLIVAARKKVMNRLSALDERHRLPFKQNPNAKKGNHGYSK
jgi:hypothetical protein